MKNKIKIILIIIAIILIEQIIKTNILARLSETNALNLEETYALGVNSIILLIIINIFIIYVLAKILISNYRNLSEIFKIGISLVLAGEINNLLDRIFRGNIIRYIEVYKYGSINFSDICMAIGIVVVIINFLIIIIKKQEETIK